MGFTLEYKKAIELILFDTRCADGRELPSTYRTASDLFLSVAVMGTGHISVLLLEPDGRTREFDYSGSYQVWWANERATRHGD